MRCEDAGGCLSQGGGYVSLQSKETLEMMVTLVEGRQRTRQSQDRDGIQKFRLAKRLPSLKPGDESTQ